MHWLEMAYILSPIHGNERMVPGLKEAIIGHRLADLVCVPGVMCDFIHVKVVLFDNRGVVLLWDLVLLWVIHLNLLDGGRDLRSLAAHRLVLLISVLSLFYLLLIELIAV